MVSVYTVRSDTHLTSTLIVQKWNVIGRRRVGGSKCSGRPIFIFFLKKIGYAPWPGIMLSQTSMSFSKKTIQVTIFQFQFTFSTKNDGEGSLLLSEIHKTVRTKHISLICELKTCLETVRIVYWHKYIWSIIHVNLVGKSYIKLWWFWWWFQWY